MPLADWAEADVQEYGQRENLSLAVGAPVREQRAPRRLLRVVACGGAAAGKRALIAALPEFGIAAPSDDDPRSLISSIRPPTSPSIVVDAAGIEATTRRHSVLCALLGVRNVALIVDAATVTGATEAAFGQLEGEFRKLAAGLGLAAGGPRDTVSARATTCASAPPPRLWYSGPTVVELLDRIERDAARPPSSRCGSRCSG